MKERRRYPRLEVELPLDIVLSDGAVLAAKAINICINGLQLSCDHATALRLVPKGYLAKPGQQIGGVLRLELPFVTQPSATIEIHCKVVNLRRLSANEYRFNVAFLGPEGQAHRLLESFIDERTRRP
jgi:hypothetical protein